ncbi:Ras- protein Rab-27A [Cichlidogyrus casuarinus]|uniref:Ras- protein Rab-27A n=1 Tax=Cichlidogyrus casuarinus TaxID=1844966 RepID=A0ABD2Q0Q8_9PLAT
MLSDHSEQYDYSIKLLTLGDSSVGKTSILYRYTEEAFSRKFISTVGVDFRKKTIEVKNGERMSRMNLQLWDTAGQERFRSLTIAFFRDAMGFILVFDLTNEESFINLRKWLSLMREHAYCDEPNFVLVGNKADMVENRKITAADASRLAEEFGCVHNLIVPLKKLFRINYFETSAKTGENVDIIIESLVLNILEKIIVAEKMGTSEGLPYHKPPSRSMIPLWPADEELKENTFCLPCFR